MSDSQNSEHRFSTLRLEAGWSDASLFFQNELGLLGGALLTIGAGYIAEGNWLVGDSEFPQRLLALSVGIVRVLKDVLRLGQVVLRGMKRMIDELQGLLLHRAL